MRRFITFPVGGLALMCALSIAMVGATAGWAADVQHGISFTKGCASPTHIGQPYSCSYSVRNNVDEAQDTLTMTGLADTVHSAGGDVGSGNVMTSLKFEIGAFLPGFSTPPTCNGIGTGTAADPFRNATTCTLPFGSRLNVQPFSFYTVQAADFNLAGHVLTDSANLTWHDTCNDPAGTGNSNCVPNPPNVGAGSQTLVIGLTPTVTTQIHNAAHAVVTAVAAGATVHDFVTVSGGAGNPVPTGSVTLDWFLNGSCTGAPQANSGALQLVNGAVDATSFPFTVSAGGRAFKAHYLGDPANPVYDAADGACEPLSVVDANIQISPNGVNRVGQSHTFVAHMNVNDGSGPQNAPNGTVVNFSFNGNPPSQQCTTAGGTGSCSITYSSALTGVDTVVASANVTVNGVPLTRSTDGTGANSGPATKQWVNAKIAISPTATNPVGAPHTFTVTLQKDTGNPPGFVGAGGEHVSFTLTNAGGANAVLDVAASTCDDAGANTTPAGQCTIVFTSATPGTVTGHASATLSVAGSAPFTVQTNGVAPNSADAVKTFVDANIQITPPTANNPVGTNHTLTCHINVNPGTGFVNAPNGTICTVAITAGPGTPTTQNCTTSGGTGSCTATITSSTAGTTTVSASTNVTVGGVVLTRSTNGTGANSGPATKLWADVAVRTDVHNASHAVIATANSGDVVHDKVFVTKAAGTPASVPNPTGSVVFHRYSTVNCTGASTDQTVALAADGTAESATFTVAADISYKADYSGDANYPARSGACEPLTVAQNFGPALTPGFWKNHQAATTALLPVSLGNYVVNTFAKARAVFDAMKCSSPIDCLAGHELAAKLDLKGGSNPSITPVIAQADALLIAVNYNGPGNFTAPTPAQKELALKLEVLIDAYTNQ